RLASGSRDKTACVWDAATGKELVVFRGHQDPVGQVVFSPDGKLVASSSNPDGKLVAFGVSADVKLWNAASGTMMWTHSKDSKDFNEFQGLIFGAGGKNLIAIAKYAKKSTPGGNSEPAKNIVTWDVATGKEILAATTSVDSVVYLAINHDAT